MLVLIHSDALWAIFLHIFVLCSVLTLFFIKPCTFITKLTERFFAMKFRWIFTYSGKVFWTFWRRSWFISDVPANKFKSCWGALTTRPCSWRCLLTTPSQLRTFMQKLDSRTWLKHDCQRKATNPEKHQETLTSEITECQHPRRFTIWDWRLGLRFSVGRHKTMKDKLDSAVRILFQTPKQKLWLWMISHVGLITDRSCKGFGVQAPSHHCTSRFFLGSLRTAQLVHWHRVESWSRPPGFNSRSSFTI